MKFPTFSISLSLMRYKQKCPYQNTSYCPDGLLVKLSVFQADRAGSNPAYPDFIPKLFFFHYKLMLEMFVYMFLNYSDCF